MPTYEPISSYPTTENWGPWVYLETTGGEVVGHYAVTDEDAYGNKLRGWEGEDMLPIAPAPTGWRSLETDHRLYYEAP